MRTTAELIDLLKNANQPKDKSFFEKYALDILTFHFPKRFVDMKPTVENDQDFSNDLIGLEVTRAITNAEGNIDSFFRQYKGKPFTTIPSKRLLNLGFDKAPVPDGKFYSQRSKDNGKLLYAKNLRTGEFDLVAYFSRMGEVNDFATILDSIVEKTGKLNAHYTSKTEHNLAIIVPEQLNYIGVEDEVTQSYADDFKTEYQRQSFSGNKKFDYIYLIFMDNVFEFDTATQTIKRIIMPAEVLIKLGYVLSESEKAEIESLKKKGT